MKYVNEECIIYFFKHSINWTNDFFFFRKVIEWPGLLTYLSIKKNNDALKRRSNADFRFSDTSVCLTIDFLRIKLQQIRGFPLFSRPGVLKTVKIGKIVFTYPFYPPFVFVFFTITFWTVIQYQQEIPCSISIIGRNILLWKGCEGWRNKIKCRTSLNAIGWGGVMLQ